LHQEKKHQISFCIVVSALGLGLWPRLGDFMKHKPPPKNPVIVTTGDKGKPGNGHYSTEKFDHGDFPAWLGQFECCASANKWTDEDIALKLPAFLRGVAATHFHTLSDAEEDSHAHFVENLKAALCPAVCKEMFYADFTARLLHDKEDPAVPAHDRSCEHTPLASLCQTGAGTQQRL